MSDRGTERMPILPKWPFRTPSRKLIRYAGHTQCRPNGPNRTLSSIEFRSRSPPVPAGHRPRHHLSHHRFSACLNAYAQKCAGDDPCKAVVPRLKPAVLLLLGVLSYPCHSRPIIRPCQKASFKRLYEKRPGSREPLFPGAWQRGSSFARPPHWKIKGRPDVSAFLQ